MQFSWQQHLEAARVISSSEPQQQGTALALMGLALLLLANDLAQSDHGSRQGS